MNRVVTKSLVRRSSDTSIEFKKGFQEHLPGLQHR